MSALPLDVLACPSCHAPLVDTADALGCVACGARYDRVEHTADLVPADLRVAMAAGSRDLRWARWREAIRGLDAWRARRQSRARGGVLPSDGTDVAATRALFEAAEVRGVVVDVGAKDGGKRALMGADVRYVGVDPFAEHVPGLPANAVVVRGVAEALPLRDGCVDAVVSLAAFDYFVDGRAALREMARVLRPGGTVALLVSVVAESVALARQAPDRASRAAHALRAARDVGPGAALELAAAALAQRDRAHTHYYTAAALRTLVAERFVLEWLSEAPQPASTILYLAARKPRA